MAATVQISRCESVYSLVEDLTMIFYNIRQFEKEKESKFFTTTTNKSRTVVYASEPDLLIGLVQ